MPSAIIQYFYTMPSAIFKTVSLVIIRAVKKVKNVSPSLPDGSRVCKRL